MHSGCCVCHSNCWHLYCPPYYSSTQYNKTRKSMKWASGQKESKFQSQCFVPADETSAFSQWPHSPLLQSPLYVQEAWGRLDLDPGWPLLLCASRWQPMGGGGRCDARRPAASLKDDGRRASASPSGGVKVHSAASCRHVQNTCPRSLRTDLHNRKIYRRFIEHKSAAAVNAQQSLWLSIKSRTESADSLRKHFACPVNPLVYCRSTHVYT